MFLPGRFIPGIHPPAGLDDAYVFAFRGGNEILVDAVDPDRLLAIDPDHELSVYLGLLDGRACFGLALPEEASAPSGCEFRDLRRLFGVMDEELRVLACGALELLHWRRMNRFCGRCGTKTVPHETERANFCPGCNNLIFPRIDMAVITGVVRDGKLLLAHNRRFRGQMHSLIAGFVEIGETLEQTVCREIREEVGIAVENVRYFGSQCWPYPSTMMVGFGADYVGGELQPDGHEIEVAGWFAPDEFPEIPRPGSISRQIIDAFVAGSL